MSHTFYYGPCFKCQLCDRVADPGFNPFKDPEEWAVYPITFQEGSINIITCPDCGELEPEQVFMEYKKRIRAGEVPAFH